MSTIDTAIEICRLLGSGDRLITGDLLESKTQIAGVIERNQAETSAELVGRVQDFNELIDSILSASGAKFQNVILDRDMLEILRQHRILNSHALNEVGK